MDTTHVVVPTITIATSSARTHAQKNENDNDHPGGREGGGER